MYLLAYGSGVNRLRVSFAILICLLYFSVCNADARDKCAGSPTSSVVINVKNTGAKGNGKADDTAAIQAAVNQVSGTGGTVLVPDGTYMINAITSILLESDLTLRMSEGAVLSALPNGKANYSIITIKGASNVNVIGGTLIGERDKHFGKSGEWGMGITLLTATNIVIDGVTVKNSWGDGFYIGDFSKNVVFCSVIADNNRRQGMSIVSVDGMVVRDSIFKNTAGTAPQAGIDIEPDDNDTVNNVKILNSKFMDNKGLGIHITVPRDIHGIINNIIIDGNTISGNQVGGIGVYNTFGHKVINNVVRDNKGFGIFLNRGTKQNTITGNRLLGKMGIRDEGGNVVLNNDIVLDISGAVGVFNIIIANIIQFLREVASLV